MSSIQVTLIGGPMDLQRHPLKVDDYGTPEMRVLMFAHASMLKPTHDFYDVSIGSAVIELEPVKRSEYVITKVPKFDRYSRIGPDYHWIGVWVEGTGY